MDANCQDQNWTTTGCECDDLHGHRRGQVLGGIWTRIKNDFIDLYQSEPENGLELARDLHVTWILLTAGGDPNQVCESAHPGTLIEVLVADTDGLGETPHCEIIRDAFDKHGINDNGTCPP